VVPDPTRGRPLIPFEHERTGASSDASERSAALKVAGVTALLRGVPNKTTKALTKAHLQRQPSSSFSAGMGGPASQGTVEQRWLSAMQQELAAKRVQRALLRRLESKKAGGAGTPTAVVASTGAAQGAQAEGAVRPLAETPPPQAAVVATPSQLSADPRREQAAASVIQRALRKRVKPPQHAPSGAAPQVAMGAGTPPQQRRRSLNDAPSKDNLTRRAARSVRRAKCVPTLGVGSDDACGAPASSAPRDFV
jgi:hypothetical protein